MSKTLYIVGIGPGDRENMTLRADRVLRESDVIAGYTTYVDLVRPMYPGKEYMETPMREERKRCALAIESARAGKKTAMVCSGDATVFGMAALVYEMRGERPDPEIKVVPGLTAAQSGGACLGAPLTDDFSVISLSDYLTPASEIRRRLRAAAQSDMFLVLYNPRSRARPDSLKDACQVLLETLPETRICGVVRNIGRDEEEKKLLTLRELEDYPADMFCTIFVGSSKTEVIGGEMVTPRGYRHV